MRFGVGVAQGISAELAGRVAEELFVTPRRSPRPPREEAWLARARPFAVPFEGQPLAAWTWGDEGAPAVLLVHGWEGRGAQLGALIDPLLERGCRVIAFDAPAHGATGGRRLTLVHLARAVLAVAEASGGPLLGVVAHSFGAAAVTLALTRGLAVERAAYLAPAGEIQEAVRRFVRWARLGEVAAVEFRRRLESRAGAAIAEIDALALAASMTTPILVVHDHEDREIPVREGRAIAARWPGATLFTTRGLGHHHLLRDPDVVRGLAGWLAVGQVPRTMLEELERELFTPSLRVG